MASTPSRRPCRAIRLAGRSKPAPSINLGIVRIKRNDYTFDKVVPTFADLPTELQSQVLNPDAIAVNVGGVLSSITYEYGVESLGDSPQHRTRLGYDIASDFPKATTDLVRTADQRLGSPTTQPTPITFTSTTTSEVWTLDETWAPPI